MERTDAVDSLSQFLLEIGRFPLLTRTQEVELSRRIERGDRAAREQLVNSNLRLVVSISKRYQRSGVPLLDLIQDGSLGLLRAVEKFDWRRGYRFSTYATWWIRQSVQRGIDNRSRLIRVPVHVKPQARATAARVVDSLDRPLVDGGGIALGDHLPGEDVDPVEEVEARLAADCVRDAVRSLPELERRLIQLRYGLADCDPATLEETRLRLGLRRGEAARLERQAMRRLAREPRLVQLHAA